MGYSTSTIPNNLLEIKSTLWIEYEKNPAKAKKHNFDFSRLVFAYFAGHFSNHQFKTRNSHDTTSNQFNL